MFSYGSGSAASMFTLKVVKDLNPLKSKLNFLSQLNDRIKIDPTVYDKMMNLKEKIYGKKDLHFELKENFLRNNTFFLESIDSMWVRNYRFYSNGSIKSTIESAKLSRLITVSNHLLSDSSPKGKTSGNIWNGFFNKTMGEKHSLLKQTNPDIQLEAFENGGLPLSRANLMIENCIGKISLPVGLGLNLSKI